MDRLKKILVVTAAALASWVGVSVAQQAGRLLHMTAMVQKVDLTKREVTLQDSSGTQRIVQVPEDVTRLDQVKKGDRLDVDYYESVALSLKKPGEAAEGTSDARIVERKPGPLPGGMVARKISASVEIMKVDPAKNKVTIKGPAGEVDTINVSDPDVQSKLRNLKKGDQVEVTYSQAIAASVTPKEK